MPQPKSGDRVNLNPYILLTPGPLSTSPTVKETMLRDWCTWDADYNEGVVQDIRRRLTRLAAPAGDAYTTVLMQGSGTFAVEAALQTMLPRLGGRILICSNGAYGDRMALIAERLALPHTRISMGETAPVTAVAVAEALEKEPAISHVAVVHNETTTGMLNPLEEIARVVVDAGKVLMVDAMSSFGGIPIDAEGLNIGWLVSSSNKCIQGVPGFGFVIVQRRLLEPSEGNARSLSLDLFDQWKTMETGNGKWRFTSPTHVVRAFQQALDELDEEGGIPARYRRYCENQHRLVAGMKRLGFTPLLPEHLHSPIITSFYNPDSPDYSFESFYHDLKTRGFVIYPGKVSGADCFRIGTIGEVYPDDIDRLIDAIAEVLAR